MPLPQCNAILRRHPPQGTVKELQGLLGTVNFYRCFVKGATHILCPLTDGLPGSPSPNLAVSWPEEMQRSFETVREALASSAELVHPRQNSELFLMAACVILEGMHKDFLAW